MTRAKAVPKGASTHHGVTGRAATLVFVIFGVASITALWSILSLISGGFGGYLAIVVAIAIVALLHSFGYRPGIKRAIMALLLMAASIIYQAYLFAAGTIAGEMGFSLSESAQLIGIDFAFALIRAHVTALELSCYALSVVLAVLLALLFGRK